MLSVTLARMITALVVAVSMALAGVTASVLVVAVTIAIAFTSSSEALLYAVAVSHFVNK